MNTEPIEAEVVNPELALTKHEPKQEAPGPKVALTPAQARVESVADVLAKARAQASLLKLTPEEVRLLKAEFPDEAFKMGAGGDPNLIYIEHAFLRDRFDEALGMCQWSLIRSRPHWAEEYQTSKGAKAVRIYADCALVIRGCLVAEAIGEMSYFPNNATQNYGDAAEGSETAAFRRCAKKIGVGLQAWKKDYGEGWKQRQRNPRPQQQAAPQKPAQPAEEPRQPIQFNEAKFRKDAEAWLETEKVKWVKENTNVKAWATLVVEDCILITEPMINVTATKLFGFVFEMLYAAVSEIKAGKVTESGAKRKLNTYLIEEKEAWVKKIAGTAIGPDEQAAYDKVYSKAAAELAGAVTDDSEWFWDVICPLPHRGEKRSDYEKSPDTIGSLYEAMKGGDEAAQKRLWGFARGWTPEPRTVNGKTYQPSEADLKFREALNDFMSWHDENETTE